MAEQYLTRDQLLLAEIEAARGVEESPTPADNALKVQNLVFRPELEVDTGETEHTGSLDPGEPVVLGGGVSVTFGVRMKGSGAGATAPEWGPLLRACSFAETSTASDSDTAQSGAAGPPSTITLAAGASSTDDFYKGKVIELTGGTGSGQSNVITAYDGTSKVATVATEWSVVPDNTTTYDVVAHTLYQPISSDLETVTLYGYQNANEAAVNSTLRKAIGAMGTFVINLGARAVPTIDFTFRGIIPAAWTNVARPTGVVFDSTTPPAYRSAETSYDGAAIAFSSMSMDCGGQVAQPDDPATVFGFDTAAVTSRRVTGTMTPYLRLKSTRDLLSDMIANSGKAMVWRWGTVAGNRISLLVPAAHIFSDEEQDANGFMAENIGFFANGADSGLWICVH